MKKQLKSVETDPKTEILEAESAALNQIEKTKNEMIKEATKEEAEHRELKSEHKKKT